MDNINVTPKFVMAGNATFTVSNGTGRHYTYRVYTATPTPRYPGPVWFIRLLTGPDSYKYMGRLQVRKDAAPLIQLTGKSRFSGTARWKINSPIGQEASRAVNVAQWALRVIWQVAAGKYRLPVHMSIKHDGRCGRCGAKLTHPASLDTGLGPECADKAGVMWAERVPTRDKQSRVYVGEDRGRVPYTGPTLFDGPVEDEISHPGHPSNHG